jgi:hypothetical protein
VRNVSDHLSKSRGFACPRCEAPMSEVCGLHPSQTPGSAMTFNGWATRPIGSSLASDGCSGEEDR